MRISTALTALQLSLMLAVSAMAQGTLEQLPVSARMDIYRAGGYDDGSNGIDPVVYRFLPKSGQVLIFSAVTGEWSGETGYNGPDGVTGESEQQIITNPTGTFAGITTDGVWGAMVGMFLGDGLPVVAPPPLTFTANSTEGGIPTNFRSLTPQIGEVFFIGDGLTGTGTGKYQLFRVPPTATRLFLGYLDSCTRPGPDAPGCYSDNSGTLSTYFALYDF
jgi:hypothetical protein